MSVFSPNARKYRPENDQHFDIFDAVRFALKIFLKEHSG